MKTSAEGIALIKHFEGCKLAPYKDIGGIWTVGIGHTRFAEGFAITGRALSQEEVGKLFTWDLAPDELDVSDLVGTQPQYRFDALVSFAFNLGVPALKGSTLLRLLKNGAVKSSAEEFPKWCRDGGTLVAGLMVRRKAEQRMFEGGLWYIDESGRDIR